MKNIKKKLRKKVYKIIRYLIIKEHTKDLGKIEEHDDKIICYVNNKKLKKYKSSPYYEIYFIHILDKEIATSYKLNKPIYYIIENMNFDRILQFYSVPDTYIKFKNCSFNEAIRIKQADNVIFEDNKYYNEYYLYLYNKCFLEGRVQNLEFVNEKFINSEENKLRNYFGMDIEANNIKIINSQINADEKNGTISLKAKENLIIKDSEVLAPIIEIESKNIETKDSALIATEIVNIKNENNNEIENIQSKEIIYNGLNINEENITKEKIELKIVRKELINKLMEIKNSCNNINNTIINNVSNNLNEQSISRVLKNAKK